MRLINNFFDEMCIIAKEIESFKETTFEIFFSKYGCSYYENAMPSIVPLLIQSVLFVSQYSFVSFPSIGENKRKLIKLTCNIN